MSDCGKLIILDGEQAETCPVCHDRVLRLVKICGYCDGSVCPGCIECSYAGTSACCDVCLCAQCTGGIAIACQGCKASRCKLCIYPTCKECDRQLCLKCHFIGVTVLTALVPSNMCARDWIRSGQRYNTVQALAMIAFSVLGVLALAVYFLVFFERGVMVQK